MISSAYVPEWLRKLQNGMHEYEQNQYEKSGEIILQRWLLRLIEFISCCQETVELLTVCDLSGRNQGVIFRFLLISAVALPSLLISCYFSFLPLICPHLSFLLFPPLFQRFPFLPLLISFPSYFSVTPFPLSDFSSHCYLFPFFAWPFHHESWCMLSKVRVGVMKPLRHRKHRLMFHLINLHIAYSYLCTPYHPDLVSRLLPWMRPANRFVSHIFCLVIDAW